MKAMFLAKLCLAASLTTASASAADHYVRTGASGNGADWSNAYGQLPGTLIRGDTYYIADGDYPSHTFDEAVSGTARITIRKATVARHGTGTGWSDAYGDGQATFAPLAMIDTGFITLDGQVEYGIRIRHLADDGAKLLNIGGWADMHRDGIELRYVEMAGPQSATPGQNYPFKLYTDCISGISKAGSAWMIRDLLVSHCNIHGGAQLLQICNMRNAIFEHSRIHDCLSTWSATTDIHNNVFYMRHFHGEIVFRYNEIYNWNGQGIYPNSPDSSDSTLRFHGNWFHDNGTSGNPAFPIWFYEYDVAYGANFGAVYIDNNTFSDIWNLAIYASGQDTRMTGGEIKNNIFHNTGGATYNILAHDHNWYSGSSAHGEANGIAGGSANPFHTIPDLNGTVGAAYPRNKGAALASMYQVDAAGQTRGADGAWDIGAYEYGSAATPIAPAIATQPVSVTKTAGQTATFAAVATGNPIPTYQWQKNNVAIAGATAASYTTPASTLADSGATFRLVASNSLGTAMSSPATLTVTAPTAAIISVSPAAPTFTGTVGGPRPSPITVTVSTANGNPWSSADSSPFFDAAPTSGPSGATQTLTPSAGWDALPAGTRTAPITYSAAGLSDRVVQVSAVKAASTATGQAPTVSAATATPSPVTGTTASLSAIASDDGGEPALTYTWAASGPAAVTFTPNGSNAAKASTARFAKVGAYILTVTAKDAANLTGTKTVTVTVNATPTLSISPTGASVQPGMTVDFNAVVRDQFNVALRTQPTVTWTVSGGGTVNANGLFTAGAGAVSPTGGISATTYVVTATAGSVSGTALVTVSTASTASADGSASGGPRCGSGSALALIAGLGLMLARRRRR